MPECEAENKQNITMKTISYKNHEITISPDGKTVFCDGNYMNQHITSNDKGRKGCHCVTIDGRSTRVSRLNAMAHVPNPAPHKLNKVAFVNGNSLNPHRDNLKWTNSSMIAEEAHLKSYKRGRSTISIPLAKHIAKRIDQGETLKALAAEYGVSDMTIHRIKVKYLTVKA